MLSIYLEFIKLVLKGLQTASLTPKHSKNYTEVWVLSVKNSNILLVEHCLKLSLLQLYPY